MDLTSSATARTAKVLWTPAARLSPHGDAQPVFFPYRIPVSLSHSARPRWLLERRQRRGGCSGRGKRQLGRDPALLRGYGRTTATHSSTADLPSGVEGQAFSLDGASAVALSSSALSAPYAAFSVALWVFPREEGGLSIGGPGAGYGSTVASQPFGEGWGIHLTLLVLHVGGA